MEAWMSLEDGAEQHLMSYVGEVARAWRRNIAGTTM